MSRKDWNYLWRLLKDIGKSRKGILVNILVLMILFGTLFFTVSASRGTENFNRIRDLARDLEAGFLQNPALVSGVGFCIFCSGRFRMYSQ